MDASLTGRPGKGVFRACNGWSTASMVCRAKDHAGRHLMDALRSARKSMKKGPSRNCVAAPLHWSG